MRFQTAAAPRFSYISIFIAILAIPAAIPALNAFAAEPTWTNYMIHPEVRAVVVQGDHVWAGTEWDGLIKINRKTGSREFYTVSNSALPSNCIKFLSIDHDGTLWIVAGNNLVKFDGTTWSVCDLSNSGMPEGRITCMTADKNGGVWLGVAIDVEYVVDRYGRPVYHSPEANRNRQFTFSPPYWDGGVWRRSYHSNKIMQVLDSIIVKRSRPNRLLWTNKPYCLLIHYDGKNREVIDDTNSEIKDRITCIAQSGDGTLWIGTGKQGLIHYDGAVWSTYQREIDRSQEKLLVIGRHEKKVPSPEYNGVVNFNGTDWATGGRSFSGFPNNRIDAVTIDSSGYIWTCTGVGLVRFDGKNWKRYPFNNKEARFDLGSIDCMAIDGHDTVWVGFSHGFLRFDGSSWESFTDMYSTDAKPAEIYVRTIAIDADGNKWIGSDSGIIKYDGKKYTRFETTSSPVKGAVGCFTMDSKGEMWFVTDDGLGKFDGKNWIMYPNTGTVFSRYLRCLAIDGNQVKWIGTENGLVRFDGRKWSNHKAITHENSEKLIRTIAIAGSGVIWMRIDGRDPESPWHDLGLYGFNQKTLAVFSASEMPSPGAHISKMAVSPDGLLWVGTNTFPRKPKLSKYDGKQWKTYDMDTVFKPVREDDQYYGNFDITDISFEKTGTIWIGSPWGITKFDGKNWTMYDSTNSVLRNGFPHCITIDSAGIKWIAAEYGLIKFDDKQWTVYDAENSGFPGSASRIVIDKSNRKWFSTKEGWTVFDDGGE